MDKKTQALVEQYAKSLVEIAIEKDSLAELQSETEALFGDQDGAQQNFQGNTDPT